MTWKVMLRNVWSDIVSGQTRRLKQLYKVSTLCFDDHHFEEELKSEGELSKVCSQIVFFLNVYSWHVLEDLIFCGQ